MNITKQVSINKQVIDLIVKNIQKLQKQVNFIICIN